MGNIDLNKYKERGTAPHLLDSMVYYLISEVQFHNCEGFKERWYDKEGTWKSE